MPAFLRTLVAGGALKEQNVTRETQGSMKVPADYPLLAPAKGSLLLDFGFKGKLGWETM